MKVLVCKRHHDDCYFGYDNPEHMEHTHKMLWEMWKNEIRDPGPKPEPPGMLPNDVYKALPENSAARLAEARVRREYASKLKEWQSERDNYITACKVRDGEFNLVPELSRWFYDVSWINVSVPT